MDRAQADADAIIDAKGLRQITDTGAIEQAIAQVMAANPGQLADYRAGKDKLFGFFVGQVMKATAGKANPAQVNELLKKMLAGPMTAPGDLLHRFLFERLPVRGHLVRLDASWRAAIEHHEYPEAVAAVLGEAMAASALMAGALKFEGRLSLQFEGPGPVRLMLAQCTHRHAIRGVARHDDAAARRAPADGLFGDGQLAVTIEQTEGGERYQGVVPLVTARLADCLEQYFERSEQLPSRLVLAATPDRAAGLLLQRVAMGEGGTASERSAADDAWLRLGLLAATVSPKELFDLPCRELLASPVSGRRHPPVRGRARLLPMHLLARAGCRHPAGARRRGGIFAPGRAGRRRGALRILQPRLALRRGRRRGAVLAGSVATGAAGTALAGTGKAGQCWRRTSRLFGSGACTVIPRS